MALTLRTTADFDAYLNNLKSRLNIGTGSGVIKFIVKNYADTIDDLQKTRKELAETKQLFERLIDIERKKTTVQIELSSFLKKFDNI